MGIKEELEELKAKEARRLEKLKQRQARFKERSRQRGKVQVTTYIMAATKARLETMASSDNVSMGDIIDAAVNAFGGSPATSTEPNKEPLSVTPTATDKEPLSATPSGLETIRAAVDKGAKYDEIRVDLLAWMGLQRDNQRTWAEIAADLNAAEIPKKKRGPWSGSTAKQVWKRRDR